MVMVWRLIFTTAMDLAPVLIFDPSGKVMPGARPARHTFPVLYATWPRTWVTTIWAERPAALADAILKLYKLPLKTREEMGKKGRSYFEKNFEREILINRLEELMKDVVTHKATV